MRVYQRDRWWYIDLRSLGGKRVVMRDPSAPGWPDAGLRTEDKRTAVEWRAAYVEHMQAAAARAHERATGNFKTLGAAAGAFLEHRTIHTEPSTASGSRTALAHLREALGDDVHPTSITPRELQAVIDGFLRDGYEPNTVRNTRNHWAAFFSWLEFESNPARRTKVPVPDPREVEAWDGAQCRRIRSAADALDARCPGEAPRRRLVAEVLLCMGPRIQEAAALRWERIDGLLYTARIVEQAARQGGQLKRLKGSGPRTTVVLHEWWEVHEPGRSGLVLAGADGSPVPARTLHDIVAEILIEAGLKKVGEAAHQFRHTFAFLFLERGGSLTQLQKILGHEDIRTTQRYYDHWTSEHASKSGVEAIYGRRQSIRRSPRRRRDTPTL